MLGKRAKPIMIAASSLCVLAMACALVYTRITSFLNMMEISSKGQAPTKSLILRIDKNQREELFEKLSNFAKKHGFNYDLTDFNTNGENLQFWMSGDGVTIIAGDIPPDPARVSVSFYAKYPGYPVDEESVDELFGELRNLISEIPNVIITEEK